MKLVVYTILNPPMTTQKIITLGEIKGLYKWVQISQGWTDYTEEQQGDDLLGPLLLIRINLNHSMDM